jgi:GNAT superfamily N-acetyltransferase
MIATVAHEPANSLRGPALLRQAHRNDVPAIQRVRHSVRENRLVSRTISDEDVIVAIEKSGRGWVIEVDKEIVGFAIGNAVDGNVWALFVDPAHEGRGHGRRLHDAMVKWMKSQGLRTLWLTTEPGTRAQAFYERAGWSNRGLQSSGELRFELDPSTMAGCSGGERG